MMLKEMLQANFAEESKAQADAMVENLRSAFKELVPFHHSVDHDDHDHDQDDSYNDYNLSCIQRTGAIMINQKRSDHDNHNYHDRYYT